jgi:D-glycero-D-manno-heptose 1,7-bisphosphate phosphatase
MTSGSIKCVFFDRDGIVNRCPNPARYVMGVESFHLLPEFIESLRVVDERHFKAVVVTNQSGVDRGALTQETIDEIHDHLHAELEKVGLGLLDVMVCTSADDNHTHRKPNPGMLLDAAAKYGLDLAQSWMIGDQERDVVAGKRAGCGRTVLVRDSEKPTVADFHLKSMSELAEFLRKNL